jgi:amino acid transporter
MCASIIALAGTYLYVELGLTIPRFTWNGTESCTPQTGGELNYLAYIMKAPKYFSTCVFGIAFMILANTAANSINFGHQAQIASGRSESQVTYSMTAGIGIVATTFACLLHALSRKYGIWLNNVLGFTKFLILLFIIIIGFTTVGVLRGRGSTDSDAAGMNSLDPTSAFEKTGTHHGPFRFAEAFLFVMFPVYTESVVI